MEREPHQAIENGPIETYLDSARVRFLSRHEQDAVDAVLAEFHAHLVESAQDLELQVGDRYEAERLAVESFGGARARPYIDLVMARSGRGDRRWGSFGMAWSVVCLVAFTLLAFYSDQLSGVNLGLIRGVFFASIGIYGFACWRAGGYAGFRYSAAIGCALLAGFSLLSGEPETQTTGSPPGDLALRLLSGRPAPEVLPVGLRDEGVLLASMDSGTMKALIEAVRNGSLEPQPDLKFDFKGEQALLPQNADSAPRLGAGVIGHYSVQPFPFAVQLHDALPAVARIGSLWLLCALVVRCTCQWLSQLRRASPYQSGVWIT